MEPVRSNRPSPWNRGGRESVFPRFAGLAVDGIQKKDEAPRACLSPQRLWAARISLLARAASSDARDIAYSGHVFDALDAYTFRHSKPPRGEEA